MPGEVGVPGVGVGDVGAGDTCDHFEVDAESPHSGVGAVELGDLGIADHPGVGALGTRLARTSEGAHANIRQGTKNLGQLVDVHSGPAVDEGRVLLGQQVDPHGCVSSLAPLRAVETDWNKMCGRGGGLVGREPPHVRR